MVQKVDKYFLLLVEETVEKQPEEDSIATNICIKTEVQEEHLNNIYRISITRNTDRRKAIHVFLFKYLYTWHSMNLKKSFSRSFKKIILNVHFKVHESRSTSNEQSFTNRVQLLSQDIQKEGFVDTMTLHDNSRKMYECMDREFTSKRNNIWSGCTTSVTNVLR